MFILFLCLTRPFFANGVGAFLVKDFLWKKIMRGKFREEEGDWRLGVVRDSYGVGVQKEIEKQWDFSNTKISFETGNGNRVKFWKDGQCSEEPLCETFPSLFALSDSKEAWELIFGSNVGKEKIGTFILLGT